MFAHHVFKTLSRQYIPATVIPVHGFGNAYSKNPLQNHVRVRQPNFELNFFRVRLPNEAEIH